MLRFVENVAVTQGGLESPSKYCHNIRRGKTRMMDLPGGDKV